MSHLIFGDFEHLPTHTQHPPSDSSVIKTTETGPEYQPRHYGETDISRCGENIRWNITFQLIIQRGTVATHSLASVSGVDPISRRSASSPEYSDGSLR